MTERSVKVTLQAEAAGYIAGMKQAAVATRGVATEVVKRAAANRRQPRDEG